MKTRISQKTRLRNAAGMPADACRAARATRPPRVAAPLHWATAQG